MAGSLQLLMWNRITIKPPLTCFVEGSSRVSETECSRTCCFIAMTQHTLPIFVNDTVLDQFLGEASFQSNILLFAVFPALHVCMCIQCLACQGVFRIQVHSAASDLSSSSLH